MPTSYPGTDIYTGPRTDPVAAFGLAHAVQRSATYPAWPCNHVGPFRLTHDRAVELAAMTPGNRDLALQDAFHMYLVERDRLEAGAAIWRRCASALIARRWDAEGARFMDEARAEYRRALAEAERLAA
jgi:hypothetical protein